MALPRYMSNRNINIVLMILTQTTILTNPDLFRLFIYRERAKKPSFYLFIQRVQISYVLCFVWHNPCAKFDESIRGLPSSFLSRSAGATNFTFRFLCFLFASPLLAASDFVVSLLEDFAAAFEWRGSLCEVTPTLGLVLCFLLTWEFLLRLSGDNCLAFFPFEHLLYFPRLWMKLWVILHVYKSDFSLRFSPFDRCEWVPAIIRISGVY